jgi:ParB family chromosome partitioning protein
LRRVGLRVTGNEIGRVASDARRGENLMTKAVQKITLSPSRDIPFDKLVLSQSNVRRIKAGVVSRSWWKFEGGVISG